MIFKLCPPSACLACFGLLLSLTLPSPPTWAVAYGFPGNLPAGCSGCGSGSKTDLDLFISDMLNLGYQSLIRGKVEAACIHACDVRLVAADLLKSTSSSVQLLDCYSVEQVSSGTGAINLGRAEVISGNIDSTGGISIGRSAVGGGKVSGVVQNYLDTAGLNLDATIFAGTAQNKRVGRSVPAGFAASNALLTHRQAASCNPASVFSYLGEDFKIAFTLTAQNAQGATTQNYTDVFAKQDLSVLNLAGIQGSTPFKTGGRLSGSSGSWSQGQACPILIARVSRSSRPDGPFASANFGIVPVDADNVGIRSFDLDTDSPANGNDSSALKTAAALLPMPVPLRFAQLRLQNAIGPATQDLSLPLPLQAQYWKGTNFITSTDDSCISIDAKTVNFGNYRKTLVVGNGSLISMTYQLNKDTTSLGQSRPGGGRSGSPDVALSLNTLSDQSCLQTFSPSPAATATASLAYLQGAWCGTNPPSYVNDSSAQVAFGLFRSSDNMIYQRENY